MKTISTVHSYADHCKSPGTSEHAHMADLNHFQTKISAEVFRKSSAERAELATRMAAYPSRNGAPVPPNN